MTRRCLDGHATKLRRHKLKTRQNTKAELMERLRATTLFKRVQKKLIMTTATIVKIRQFKHDWANNKQRWRNYSRGRKRHLLTFKSVEDSIDTFDRDKNENVKQWIRDFDETARLYQCIKKKKTIYAKRLLRGSARRS